MTDTTASEIRSLEAALAAVSADAFAGYPGMTLTRESLERQLSELRADEGDSRLMLLVTRSPRHGTGAEIGLIAGILASLQESLASIAQVIAGRPTGEGRSQSTSKRALRCGSRRPRQGRLRLNLVAAFPETQAPLFEGQDEPVLELSVHQLLELMRCATGDRALFLENVGSLGPRGTGHVQALAKALSEGGASVNFEWRSPRGNDAARLDARSAASLRAILDEVDEVEREVVQIGRLVGGSLVHGTFELELGDGSVISGKADDGALENLARLFGESCTATILVRELTLKTGETKDIYRLVGLTS